MHITGSRDGPPVKVGVAVTDLTTGKIILAVFTYRLKRMQMKVFILRMLSWLLSLGEASQERVNILTLL